MGNSRRGEAVLKFKNSNQVLFQRMLTLFHLHLFQDNLFARKVNFLTLFKGVEGDALEFLIICSTLPSHSTQGEAKQGEVGGALNSCDGEQDLLAHCEQIELDIAPYPFVKYNFSDRCHYPNTRISTFEDIYFLKEYIKCITNFQKNAEQARIKAWIRHHILCFLISVQGCF